MLRRIHIRGYKSLKDVEVKEKLPNLLVVATDANCQGPQKRRSEITAGEF